MCSEVFCRFLEKVTRAAIRELLIYSIKLLEASYLRLSKTIDLISFGDLGRLN